MLTTYGTMRRDHADASPRSPWGLVVADEAQHVKNAALLAPPGRCARSRRRRRVALTGTPVENNLTELWAILDWATPGLLGSAQRLPQGVGRADRVRASTPTKARQFADLIGPFLLRRRKSDPGIAPELPRQDRDRPPRSG